MARRATLPVRAACVRWLALIILPRRRIQRPEHHRVKPCARRSIDEAGIAAVYTVAVAVPGRQIDKALTRPVRQLQLNRWPIAQLNGHAGDPLVPGCAVALRARASHSGKRPGGTMRT